MVDLVKCVDSKTRSCGVAFARGMMGCAYLASGGVWSSEKKETCTALMCKLYVDDLQLYDTGYSCTLTCGV